MNMTAPKRGRHTWVKRQVAFNATHESDAMLNELVAEARKSDPTATLTQIMNRAVATEHARVFGT